jgi:hypothetical protein
MHLLVIFVRADIIVSCIRKTKDKNFAWNASWNLMIW